MGHADDCLAKLDTLKSDRSLIEPAWADCIALTLPMHADFSMGGVDTAANRLTNTPKSDERGRRLYDSTGVMAVDRLASGMESLVTPQSEKWHSLKSDDVFAIDESDEEKEYFQSYRDYLFTVRYDNRSGFVNAHQRALRSCVALGTGVTFIEESFGQDGADPVKLPFRYRYLPITRCFMATDQHDIPDTMYFIEPVSARVMVQRWGTGVSQKVQDCANDPKKQEEKFDVLHAVYPRVDRYRGAVGINNSAFQSAYIEIANRHLIRGRVGGYYEFPFGVYYWHKGDSAYGESAVMFALAELKGLQVMGKTGLRIHQQMGDPPLAVAHDGVKVRLNLNPRAVNYNMINPENGALLAKPIHTAQLPQVFNEYLQGKHQVVNDALYISLFQILAQNPGITATEALIRQNEKGELLGPAGSKIQAVLSQIIDRETGILERKGVYLPGSPLEPPESLAGRSFGATMTSPLDRLRRSQEGLGITRTLETVVPLAQIKPRVLDNFDEDEIARRLTEINGAPQSILHRREEVQERRAADAKAVAERQRAEQMEQEGIAAQETAAGLEAMAGAGQRVGPAMVAAQQSRQPRRLPAPPSARTAA